MHWRAGSDLAGVHILMPLLQHIPHPRAYDISFLILHMMMMTLARQWNVVPQMCRRHSQAVVLHMTVYSSGANAQNPMVVICQVREMKVAAKIHTLSRSVTSA